MMHVTLRNSMTRLATNITITMMTTGGGEGGEDAITKEGVFLFDTHIGVVLNTRDKRTLY